jgi:large subunit ribosomal protein L19
MSNSFLYKETRFKIGDTVDIEYKIKEGEKERIQDFKGIVIKYHGSTPATQMITVRKVSKTGIGIERVIPLMSPYIASMKLVKKSNYTKAKAYFLRGLTEAEVRSKIYQVKRTKPAKKKTAK